MNGIVLQSEARQVSNIRCKNNAITAENENTDRILGKDLQLTIFFSKD